MKLSCPLVYWRHQESSSARLYFSAAPFNSSAATTPVFYFYLPTSTYYTELVTQKLMLKYLQSAAVCVP